MLFFPTLHKILKLISSKCIPILLYGLQSKPLYKYQLNQCCQGLETTMRETYPLHSLSLLSFPSPGSPFPPTFPFLPPLSFPSHSQPLPSFPFPSLISRTPKIPARMSGGVLCLSSSSRNRILGILALIYDIWWQQL